MMKRLFLFISCCLYYQSLFSQTQDSLAKYSYFLQGNTGETRIVDGKKQFGQTKATCFFLRKNNAIYLVSAAHVLTGVNGNLTNSHSPDTLFVNLLNINSKTFENLAFSVAELKKSLDTNYFRFHPDFCLVKLKIPSYYQINSINSFLTDYKITSEDDIDNVTLFGYPGSFNGIEKECRFDGKSISMYKSPINPNEADLVLEKISGDFDQGDHGSPLFLRLKTSKVIFAGLCSAGSIDNTHMLFISRRYILDDFEKLGN